MNQDTNPPYPTPPALPHNLDKQRNTRFIPPSGSDSCKYFLYGGKRHVFPYHFHYLTWTKGKWFGRPLLDILTEEFVHYSRE